MAKGIVEVFLRLLQRRQIRVNLTAIRDEGADAAGGVDVALPLELAVSLLHRIRVDGDGLGKLTHRRQFFPCCHLPGHDLFLELIHDLLVDGLAAF